MAYLKDLLRRCVRCGGVAKVEAFNCYNASLGAFCRPCGKRVLREQRAAEERAAQGATS